MGVESKTVKFKIFIKKVDSPCRTVATVTNHRVTGQLRMSSDLMPAAGENLDVHHRVMNAVFDNAKKGFAVLPGAGALWIFSSAGSFGKRPAPFSE